MRHPYAFECTCKRCVKERTRRMCQGGRFVPGPPARRRKPFDRSASREEQAERDIVELQYAEIDPKTGEEL